jgi:GNAT superfamily N-acetyltransferase
MPGEIDPRLLAAELTEQEFLGDLTVYPHPGIDFLNAYREAYPWSKLPACPLICPKDGYILHYDPACRATPLVFLGCKGELVGVFENDNLTVAEDHQRKGLGSELILAGFAQAPWKDLKDRKVTEAGAAALRHAYQLAKKVTRNAKDRGKNFDLNNAESPK